MKRFYAHVCKNEMPADCTIIKCIRKGMHIVVCIPFYSYCCLCYSRVTRQAAFSSYASRSIT